MSNLDVERARANAEYEKGKAVAKEASNNKETGDVFPESREAGETPRRRGYYSGRVRGEKSRAAEGYLTRGYKEGVLFIATCDRALTPTK
jgi:hypothetical protein